MERKIYDLLDALSRTGLHCEDFGVCEDIEDTMAYFGYGNISLEGKYLYVYHKEDCGIENITPNYQWGTDGDCLSLYKLD